MQQKPCFSSQTLVYHGVKPKEECFISVQEERDEESGSYKLHNKEIKGSASGRVHRTTGIADFPGCFAERKPDVIFSCIEYENLLQLST